MSDVNHLLAREIEDAINAGVINGIYSNFNVPSISELEQRIRALDEIDTYVVIKSLIKYHRELFVKVLEHMNKEGEKKNENY